MVKCCTCGDEYEYTERDENNAVHTVVFLPIATKAAGGDRYICADCTREANSKFATFYGFEATK